jgi:hypothetical protein
MIEGDVLCELELLHHTQSYRAREDGRRAGRYKVMEQVPESSKSGSPIIGEMVFLDNERSIIVFDDMWKGGLPFPVVYNDCDVTRDIIVVCEAIDMAVLLRRYCNVI